MDSVAERLSEGTPEGVELDRERQLTKELRAELKDAARNRERLERELGILSNVGQRRTPPSWLKAPGKPKGHRAQPWLLLSDLHLDEVVNPAEVQGVNAYNREIARLRLHETARRFVSITRDYWTGVTYDGAVVPLAGDIFSGDIHEELTQTNEDTVLGSLDYWIDELAAVLSMLADEFGKVHVPVVVGNHGRRTRKPRSKMRARDNFDWFLGMALQRIFRDDDRVTFDVSESADLLVESYDRRVMLTHGDQARGGNGIAGIYSPIMKLDARKTQRQAAVSQPYDLLVMGHWHSLIFGAGWVVNGSLKGYDEYAFTSNFELEPPAQAAWLMSPEHGRTWMTPIYPMDRAKEGW